MIRNVIAMLAAGAFMTGCIPYPNYKTLQPSARMTVLDQNGAPLANAEVTLISSAYPYGRVKTRVAKMSDAKGSATFDSVREMRVETLTIHGAEEYYWNWCVRKEGYATYVTTHGDSDDFESAPRVKLVPGPSSACPAEI